MPKTDYSAVIRYREEKKKLGYKYVSVWLDEESKRMLEDLQGHYCSIERTTTAVIKKAIRNLHFKVFRK